MRTSVLFFVGLIAALSQLVAPTAVRSQERSGTAQHLSGTVRDTLGRPLPGVEVTLQAADGRVVWLNDSYTVVRDEFGTVDILINNAGLQSDAPFDQMPTGAPEPPQRPTQPQARRCVAMLDAPTEHRPQVVMLLLQSVQPRHLLRTIELRLGLLGQRQEEMRMLLAYGRCLR